jgi:hypothetical protein
VTQRDVVHVFADELVVDVGVPVEDLGLGVGVDYGIHLVALGTGDAMVAEVLPAAACRAIARICR